MRQRHRRSHSPMAAPSRPLIRGRVTGPATLRAPTIKSAPRPVPGRAKWRSPSLSLIDGLQPLAKEQPGTAGRLQLGRITVVHCGVRELPGAAGEVIGEELDEVAPAQPRGPARLVDPLDGGDGGPRSSQTANADNVPYCDDRRPTTMVTGQPALSLARTTVMPPATSRGRGSPRTAAPTTAGSAVESQVVLAPSGASIRPPRTAAATLRHGRSCGCARKASRWTSGLIAVVGTAADRVPGRGEHAAHLLRVS
jgi:hypothetical protein